MSQERPRKIPINNRIVDLLPTASLCLISGRAKLYIDTLRVSQPERESTTLALRSVECREGPCSDHPDKNRVGSRRSCLNWPTQCRWLRWPRRERTRFVHSCARPSIHCGPTHPRIRPQTLRPPCLPHARRSLGHHQATVAATISLHPGRAHPDVAFLLRCQDHRHCL